MARKKNSANLIKITSFALGFIWIDSLFTATGKEITPKFTCEEEFQFNCRRGIKFRLVVEYLQWNQMYFSIKQLKVSVERISVEIVFNWFHLLYVAHFVFLCLWSEHFTIQIEALTNAFNLQYAFECLNLSLSHVQFITLLDLCVQ